MAFMEFEMSLDKAITSGKEHRRPYYGSKSFDYTCRNHGGKGKKHCRGQCPACLSNRTHKYVKTYMSAKEAIDEEKIQD